ncbi:MAG: LysM peptidoglycan-binding domain-containing protein [Anaerolineae bacterium]|jgi:LysM repeat protein|nr:LysM peptidoglycan-binding domain-containing protein [Anaerolineae bacterium]
MSTKLLKNITLLFVIGTLLSGLPVNAQGTVVRVAPAAATVVQGATVAVTIQIDNVSNLFGAEVHLTFDPALIEVVDADVNTAGTQIGHGGFLSPDFVARNEVNQAAGTIDYAISQMPDHAAATGSGVLATITFRGKSAGSSAVAITTALLADSNGAGITAATVNGTIQVTASGDTATVTPTPTATPEPYLTPTPTPTPYLTPTPTATLHPGIPSPTPTAYYWPTSTPWPTPTATPISLPMHIQGYHVVRQGETLYSIGRAYATHPQAIAASNHILNPNRLYVGTRIAIPVAPWSPIPAGPIAQRQFTPGGSTTPTPVVPICRYTHTVRFGETLTGIGLRYGTTVWAIARANGIRNLNLIYAGQSLCIP